VTPWYGRSVSVRVKRSGDDVSIKRARSTASAVKVAVVAAPLVPRTAGTRQRRSASRSAIAAPCDPVTAAVRSAGVALAAQGGVRPLSLGYRGVHGTLVAEDTDVMQEFA